MNAAQTGTVCAYSQGEDQPVQQHGRPLTVALPPKPKHLGESAAVFSAVAAQPPWPN